MERNKRDHYLFLLGEVIFVLNSVGNFFMGIYEENYVTWIVGFVTACVAALLLYGVKKQSQKASPCPFIQIVSGFYPDSIQIKLG